MCKLLLQHGTAPRSRSKSASALGRQYIQLQSHIKALAAKVTETGPVGLLKYIHHGPGEDAPVTSGWVVS